MYQRVCAFVIAMRHTNIRDRYLNNNRRQIWYKLLTLAENLDIKSIRLFLMVLGSRPATYGRTDMHQVRGLSESVPLHENKYLLYIAICLRLL